MYDYKKWWWLFRVIGEFCPTEPCVRPLPECHCRKSYPFTIDSSRICKCRRCQANINVISMMECFLLGSGYVVENLLLSVCNEKPSQSTVPWSTLMLTRTITYYTCRSYLIRCVSEAETRFKNTCASTNPNLSLHKYDLGSSADKSENSEVRCKIHHVSILCRDVNVWINDFVSRELSVHSLYLCCSHTSKGT